jgi:branched-chain amino acid transport system substrate-binding protein
VQAFIDAYTAKFGHEPENSFAPLGYDAIGLIVNAIENAGVAEPAAIRDALEATRDYPAVTGTVSYTRENMVPPKPVSIISVQAAEFNVEEIWRPE